MRTWVALLVSGAAFAACGGAAATTQATLSLADRQPVALRGRAFHSLERVRVTLVTRVTRVKEVRASRTGTFSVAFLGTNVPHCGGMFARARGASGSLATLKIPLPACQPD
jgi:hypothetical protein